MKSYDDLQRFKEKTQTNHIEFKDMSKQTKNSDSANWAIIKQLMDEGAESVLGNGQSVHIVAPQPIAEDIFSHSASLASAAQPQTQQRLAQPTNVAAFVAARPASQLGNSLLDSISASLKPAPAVAQPVSQTPSASADLPRFKQLFSTAPEAQVTTLSKDTLLQPLLERIASCR